MVAGPRRLDLDQGLAVVLIWRIGAAALDPASKRAQAMQGAIAQDQSTAFAMGDDVLAQRCVNIGDPIMTSDAALRSDIEEELDFEPSLDASGIGISVKEVVDNLIVA